MNLVAYSDSEGSDNEAPPAPKPASRTPATASKPAFQKVVDRANPHRIKVNLPSAPQPAAAKDDTEPEGSPAKKARIGGGAFSGFNSMLPAPKKAAPPAGGSISTGKKGLGKGLGAGISLRTGAEPAFSREPVSVPDYGEEAAPETQLSERASSRPSPPRTEPEKGQSDVKLLGKPMRFMPLSVSNKKKKKPTAVPSPGLSAEKPPPTLTTPAEEVKAPPPKPKVNLFSIAQDERVPTPSTSEKYEPILHRAGEESGAPLPDESFEDSNPQSYATSIYAPPPNTSTGPQTLTEIASSLNLSEAERRQLFGKRGRGNNGPDLSAINVTDFNTDAEYAHNEQLRAAGETVQHNALKSISGTGKNSLRSLINVAATQKDALEEHFAAGRRNKREAGNKYGW